jgi:CMP-N-acetylneuraminic acid synthetase
MKKPRNIAVIPARGGSKRLRRKNIIEFLGKPIIGYTIEAAEKSAVFDNILVSTEDGEIAEIARRFGAQIIIREESLATDSASAVEVCLDVLRREKAAGRVYDVICCLYATAPLRNADDIRSTLKLIEPGKCDFAMAVTRYGHYPHQALKVDESGMLTPMWPEFVTLKGDEIGDLVVGNGSTYAVTVEAFQRCKSFYGPGLRGYFMPANRSVDIDDREDLEMALWFAEKLGIPSKPEDMKRDT